MVPITMLTRTKRTEGVNQLLTDAQREGRNSSSMVSPPCFSLSLSLCLYSRSFLWYLETESHSWKKTESKRLNGDKWGSMRRIFISAPEAKEPPPQKKRGPHVALPDKPAVTADVECWPFGSLD